MEAIKKTTPYSKPILIPIIAEDNDEEGASSASGSIPEWAMIEVNGELLLPKDLPPPREPKDRGHSQPGKENHSASGESSSLSTMGETDGDGTASFSIPPDRIELGSLRFVDKKPVMIVGSHELTGKVVEPLAQPFCVLQRSRDGSSYRIKGVVTRKVLLNQYPKVIMR